MQVERVGIGSDAAQVATLNPVKAKVATMTLPPPSSIESQPDSQTVAVALQNESRTADTEKRLEAEKQALQRQLDQANEQLKINLSSIRFKTDDTSGRSVVTIYDLSTEEIIRQLPSENALINAQRITEFLSQSKTFRADVSGMIFDDKA